MYDGSVLDHVIDKVVDIKRDNAVLKAEQQRKTLGLVLLAIVLIFVFKKKRR